jgi:uncharacterized protein GlcG (DUF336 family)
MTKKLNYALSGIVFAMGITALTANPAAGQNILSEKQISLPLAQEAAAAAIEQCRKDGYKVTVTVVDRAGRVKVVMRDDGTGPHTLDTSRRKAYTSLSFKTSTIEFAKLIALNPAAAGLKDVDGVITLGGGLPIFSGAEVIGAIGVGGAPGGDKDEACAHAGINKIAEKLK